MKISLLHPSRGRPSKSFNNALAWIHSACCEVQLIVSIDSSDPRKDEYINQYDVLIKQENADYYDDAFVLTCNDNKSLVEATNRAAMIADGDVLVYLSDDFKCPDNWGELILKEFENENRPLLVKVHDCLQKFEARVLTIPIMNRMLYDKLGYFFHPAYKSMWVDCDLFETCHSIGAIKNARHLEFPHHHYSNPNDEIRSERDDIYMRSEANWNQGLEVFNARKRQKFVI